MIFKEITKEELLKEFPYVSPIQCNWCGKFVSTKIGHFHFIPASVCGPEESYWECDKCHKK